jgi:outer membrane protein TolC
MRTSLFGIGRARMSARVPLCACLTVALIAPAGVFALGAKDGGKAAAAVPPSAAAAPTPVTAAVAAPAPAPSAGPLRLDADRAVELALQNNLGLRSGRIDVAAKQRKVDTAWNVFIPAVDVGGTLGRWNTEKSTYAFGGGGISVVSLPDWTASGSLQAQLVLNVALFEGMRNLKLDYDAGLIGYEQAKVKLERDVRKSYFSILLLKENIDLMEENIRAAERRVAQARDNYRAGFVPELSVLQAQVAAENLKPALEELRNGLDASLAAFAMNLGLPRGARPELENTPPPDFVELNADALLAKAPADRLDVRSLVASLRLVESARKLTEQQLYTPSIILGWTFDPASRAIPGRIPGSRKTPGSSPPACSARRSPTSSTDSFPSPGKPWGSRTWTRAGRS